REGFKVYEAQIKIGCGEEKAERIALTPLGSENDTCCNNRALIHVINSTNEPLIGATVQIEGEGRSITKKSEGRAVVFEELCKGTYRGSISREGYETIRFEFRVECGAVLEMRKTMQRLNTPND